jgi:hypothetical protein
MRFFGQEPVHMATGPCPPPLCSMAPTLHLALGDVAVCAHRSDRLEARHDSQPLDTPAEPAGRKGSTQPAGLPLSHPDVADAGSAPSVENEPPETAADGSLGAFSAAARAAKTSAHTAGAPSAAVAPVYVPWMVPGSCFNKLALEQYAQHHGLQDDAQQTLEFH